MQPEDGVELCVTLVSSSDHVTSSLYCWSSNPWPRYSLLVMAPAVTETFARPALCDVQNQRTDDKHM